MSDIYDYVYTPVMHHCEEVYGYSTTFEESNSECEVNTADFLPHDLQTFVDSLETIARLEQAKIIGKSKSKLQTQTQVPKKRQVTCLDSSTCESLDDNDVNSFSNLSWTSSEYLYDETYFGLPYCGQSTALYSNINSDSPLDSSESEESGIFVGSDNSDGHLYENIERLKPRTKIVSYSKCKSLKSRLIALILKKPQSASVEILSSTTIGEERRENEIDERAVKDVIKQQRKPKNTKKNKKKSPDAKSQEKFLSKALRLLTL